MKHDFLMGYPPAAGELFAAPPHWVRLRYPLGIPRRVLDAEEVIDKQWLAEQRKPLLAINHRSQTAADVRGVAITKARTLARMRAQAAEMGTSVQVRETWRDPATGLETQTTRAA